MKTPKRLENALVKLYEAFHNNTLNPEDCTACAVGNILDNHDSWKHLSDEHGSLQLSYVGRVHQNLGRHSDLRHHFVNTIKSHKTRKTKNFCSIVCVRLQRICANQIMYKMLWSILNYLSTKTSSLNTVLKQYLISNCCYY